MQVLVTACLNHALISQLYFRISRTGVCVWVGGERGARGVRLELFKLWGANDHLPWVTLLYHNLWNVICVGMMSRGVDQCKVVSVMCYDNCVGFHFNSCSPCVCEDDDPLPKILCVMSHPYKWGFDIIYCDQSHMGPLFCSNPLHTCLGMWSLISS